MQIKHHFVFLLLNFSFVIFIASSCSTQPLSSKKHFTHADTLRGSITPERAWWDVLQYNLSVTPDYNAKTIQGNNRIVFRVIKPYTKMQIDLQEPLVIDNIVLLKEKAGE